MLVKGAHPRKRLHDPSLHDEGMVTRAELSAALASLRGRCGLTQTQVARRAGWQVQFVSQLESGRGRMPDFTTLVRFGKACGVSIGLVFTRGTSVVSALTLQDADKRKSFEPLAGGSVGLSGAGFDSDSHLWP
jgi:transcriptional regulator with XRE-family HTH domain